MTDVVQKFSIEEDAEIDSDAYYTAMEAIERAEAAPKSKSFNRAYISKKTGMDPATVTRVMGGSTKNIKLKTLFKIMAALERKVFITTEHVSDLHRLKPNFSFEAPKLQVNHNNSASIIGSGVKALASKANSVHIRSAQ